MRASVGRDRNPTLLLRSLLRLVAVLRASSRSSPRPPLLSLCGPALPRLSACRDPQRSCLSIAVRSAPRCAQRMSSERVRLLLCCVVVLADRSSAALGDETRMRCAVAINSQTIRRLRLVHAADGSSLAWIALGADHTDETQEHTKRTQQRISILQSSLDHSSSRHAARPSNRYQRPPQQAQRSRNSCTQHSKQPRQRCRPQACSSSALHSQTRTRARCICSLWIRAHERSSSLESPTRARLRR